MGSVSFLSCSRCGQVFPAEVARNLCSCGAPLLANYDLQQISRSWKRETLANGPATMWRYEPVLPVDLEDAVTLGEGWTPLLPAPSLGKRIGAPELLIKDEGLNPTASFKARGQRCALTMAKSFGAMDLAIPTAGNAGGALAAYAAAAHLRAHIFMPSDVPQSNFLECRAAGADVRLVDGLISDCARLVTERKDAEGWFEVSTLKEPYRVEGKKTMGYELAEQANWVLPDAIVYPCGGGVGLIGMWKAFDEMQQLGWIGPERPKMIAVQAAGCQPIVQAFERGEESGSAWQNAQTIAGGLRVPKALGDFLVIRAIRQSGGTALAISDQDMLDGGLLMAETEGIFPAPEGGACVIAVRKLVQAGFLGPDQRIVILNTGSGLKYAEAYATRLRRTIQSDQDKLGGLITPR